MAKVTVYGTPINVYVRIVRLLLEEVGADYDLKGVDIFNGESQSAQTIESLTVGSPYLLGSEVSIADFYPHSRLRLSLSDSRVRFNYYSSTETPDLMG